MKQVVNNRLNGLSTHMDSKLDQLEEARAQFEATVHKLWDEFCDVCDQLEPAKQVLKRGWYTEG